LQFSLVLEEEEEGLTLEVEVVQEDYPMTLRLLFLLEILPSLSVMVELVLLI
jgi:hypothetical protein